MAKVPINDPHHWRHRAEEARAIAATTLAVAKATKTIPIVMASGADPVGFGLAKSLSHPGGNVTGLTNFAEELASKQIDLMRELLPRFARLAALINVTNPLHVPQWRETQAAAAQAEFALTLIRAKAPSGDGRRPPELLAAQFGPQCAPDRR